VLAPESEDLLAGRERRKAEWRFQLPVRLK
jgi:hypothetical protein